MNIISASSRRGVRFDVVAIGASLGGLEAIEKILSALPDDFPVPIVIAQHLYRGAPSVMAQILDKITPLRVKQAEHGERLRAGTVYIPVPDRHLLVTPNHTLAVTSSERVNFARPSVNVLFSSIAKVYGARAIATVMTGLLDDGAAGALAVKKAGGRLLIQDRQTALAFDMPLATLRTTPVDFILPLPGIASALVTLTMVQGADEFFKVFVPPASGSALA